MYKVELSFSSKVQLLRSNFEKRPRNSSGAFQAGVELGRASPGWVSREALFFLAAAATTHVGGAEIALGAHRPAPAKR